MCYQKVITFYVCICIGFQLETWLYISNLGCLISNTDTYTTISVCMWFCTWRHQHALSPPYWHTTKCFPGILTYYWYILCIVLAYDLQIRIYPPWHCTWTHEEKFSRHIGIFLAYWHIAGVLVYYWHIGIFCSDVVPWDTRKRLSNTLAYHRHIGILLQYWHLFQGCCTWRHKKTFFRHKLETWHKMWEAAAKHQIRSVIGGVV